MSGCAAPEDGSGPQKSLDGRLPGTNEGTGREGLGLALGKGGELAGHAWAPALLRARPELLWDAGGGGAKREGREQRDGRRSWGGDRRPAGNLVWKLKVSTRSPLPLSAGGRGRGGPILLAGNGAGEKGSRVVGCLGG